MYVCMYICRYVCMYICMHLCMNICMHLCMYIYIYIYITCSMQGLQGLAHFLPQDARRELHARHLPKPPQEQVEWHEQNNAATRQPVREPSRPAHASASACAKTQAGCPRSGCEPQGTCSSGLTMRGGAHEKNRVAPHQ